MSSCLEKVIEKLTAYKEGALTGLAEMRPSFTQKGEGLSPPRGHIPEAKEEPVSCKEEHLTGTCSFADPTTTYVKREPLWGEGGGLSTFHIKEEHRTGHDGTFYEMLPPLEFRPCRPVHIKEEPLEGEHPHHEAARREDGRLTQGSMFPAFSMFYPQPSEYGKSLTRKGPFLSHQLGPPGDKPFCCSECGRCFSQRSYFLSHQKIHSGERPFCCFRCGKSFRIKSSFSKHLRTHHQVDNPFTCPLCHKSFVHRGHFLAHQRLHAEEEKFCCALCGKSFIHHGHFLAHQRSHAEESRFSCPHCHKSFIHQGHFSAHLRVHTGEKPFVCPDCGSSFSTQHNLVVHQRLHAGSTFTLL